MRQLLRWMIVMALCSVGCVAGGPSVGTANAVKSLAPERLIEAQADFEAAVKLGKEGKHSEALIRAERALTVREAVLGRNHEDIARNLELIGKLYQDSQDLAHAEPLLQRALTIREAALGKNHPDVATSLNNLAILYAAQGLYNRAEPLFQRALTIREVALGKNHPDVATSLNNLATLYLVQGRYDQAETLYQRALTIREATTGKSHPDVATSLDNLANLYAAQGLYNRAEPLFQRALTIREVALGKNHPDVATSIDSLANLYREQGRYDRAEPLYQRAITTREATLGKSHPDVATSLDNLANLYVVQGQYDRTEPLFQRALAIREAALGPNHPDVATSIDSLANLYREQGIYDRAEPLYQRALAMREAALGPNHPDVATSLNDLALLYREQGIYDRAEPFMQRALHIRETALGEDHPDVATSLDSLAGLYFTQGLYDRAEPLYQRALAIQEAALGPNHLKVALSLNNLAVLYFAQGLYDRAEPLYQRALTIREATLSKRHPAIATSLDNLANLYRAQERYAHAEPLYQRAITIREAALGPNHPNVANSLNNLAIIYFNQGFYDRSKPLIQRALTITEVALGKNHPDVAAPLNNLAALYAVAGLYDDAETLMQRALTIQESALGPNHPDVARTLNNLATVRMYQHRVSEAHDLLSRAFSISEQRLRHEALGFSESRLSSFLDYLNDTEDWHDTFLRAHPDDVHLQHLALASALLLKGRSVAETARISRTIYQRLGPEARVSFERLRNLRTLLASRSFAGPGKLSLKDYRTRLQALSDEGDALEARLAQHAAPLNSLFSLPPPNDIVERVAAALPTGNALVEFIAYHDMNGTALPSTRPLHYLALVLFPDGSTRAADLGPAEPIDSAASRMRDALANQDVAFQDSAQRLYNLVFKPLRALLGTTRRLLLSPDGQLSFVPFAALHDGQDFLLDSYDFTYLTSGTQLLPRPEGNSTSSVIVLADPDFTDPPALLPADSSAFPPTAPSYEAFPRFLSRSGLLAAAWVRLPGTRQEATDIQRLWPQAQLFLGSAATKQRLLQLSTPAILHVATHGFFLGDAPSSPRTRSVFTFGESLSPPLQPQHEPLLNSGLVLSGATAAGVSPAHLGKSLVAALELTGLNLWGTQLVVLSACDTGRGEVRLGHGILGLRRALVVAGAETVVMSLWKVNDDSTRLLMDAYYRGLLAGQGRASALRAAMRSLRASHPHPYHWAPFIALGSDAPLHDIIPSTHPARGE